MWKWMIGIVVLTLAALAGTAAYLSDKIYLRPDHTAISREHFGQIFAPEDLKRDFAWLTQTIETLHPDFDAIVDRATYEKRKSSIFAALNRPMARGEFYVVASGINGEFSDGHTGLRRPREEWDAYRHDKLGVVPLLVTVSDAGLTVIRALGLPIEPGAQVQAINGVAALTLRNRMLARTSGESTLFRGAYVANCFAACAWAEGLRPPFQIEWTSGNGEVKRAFSEGVSHAAWETAGGTTATTPFKLNVENNIAHLVIDTFDEPAGEFEAFLKSAFAQIRDAKVDAVVLDLRRNGGGDSRQGDLLQSYLSNDELPAFSEVAVRTAPEIKARYRTLLPEEFRWIPLHRFVPLLKGIQDGPDNGFYRFDPDGSVPQNRSSTSELTFTGDVYVLIGPLTYSSAVIFAAPLKSWRRAVLIGEPAGEPLTFYGDNYEFDLPKTKLEASVSHKVFTLVGSTGPASRLEPDIHTNEAYPDAYRLALAEIAKRRKAIGENEQ
jgi:hypothetical protein